MGSVGESVGIDVVGWGDDDTSVVGKEVGVVDSAGVSAGFSWTGSEEGGVMV